MGRSTSIAAILLITACLPAVGQDLQLDEGAVGSYLKLKELSNHGSVLHVVAHPDDEDGAMLAYCARGLGARTMLFAITRGEGGANMISSHFFDELGALRTLEHLKAAHYYGIDVFYSRAADYGYSKTLDEAMGKWENGIPILEDLVEVIRRERPTVLLSRFAGDPRDGHGHHQMAGVISRLAFEAAADPSKFPKQIARGLQPWQIKKLYSRAGSPWRQPKEGDWTIALPTGTYDPVVGKSYSQIARFGLGFQRSQGITGHDGDPGPQFSYYRLLKTASGEMPAQEESLFEGLDTSLSANATNTESKKLLGEIDKALKETFDKWNPTDRTNTIKMLIAQLRKLRTLESAPARLQQQLQEAIATVAGLKLEAWATDLEGEQINHAVEANNSAPDPFEFHLRLANRSPFDIKTQQVEILEAGITKVERKASRKSVAAGEVYEETFRNAFVNSKPTRPHWSRSSISNPMYDLRPNGEQHPTPRDEFVVTIPIQLEGEVIELKTVVQTKIRHPEYGRVQYPLTVAPAMGVRFSNSAGIIPLGQETYSLPVVVRTSLRGTSNGVVKLDLPSGWTSTPREQTVSFSREDEEATVSFEVSIPDQVEQKRHAITAVVTNDGQEYRAGFETVSAPDVGRMNIYHDAVHHVEVADVRVAGAPQVGYIPGSGDKVAESLSSIGITPTMLSASDLSNGDLSRFDVIVVGVRAYAVREDIRTHNSRLLSFVKRGGTLIVQYQTPEFDENFGPYPYEMGRGPEEVSEEDAEVTILRPEHPIFTTPNKITNADFDHWFEQRGSKFWKTWDDQYTALLECHDRGQAPQEGGMLVAKFGKGVYVYSAYAWYRQLPNGVPGAYRLFANMLSLPKSGLVE